MESKQAEWTETDTPSPGEATAIRAQGENVMTEEIMRVTSPEGSTTTHGKRESRSVLNDSGMRPGGSSRVVESGNSNVDCPQNSTISPTMSPIVNVHASELPRADQILAFEVKSEVKVIKILLAVFLPLLLFVFIALAYMNWQCVDNARGEYERFRYATKQMEALIKQYGPPPVPNMQ